MSEKKVCYFRLVLALPFFPRCPAVEVCGLGSNSQERVNLGSSRADQAERMARKVRKIYGKKRKEARNRLQPDEKLKEQLRALGHIR
jgi:hypothetical protein